MARIDLLERFRAEPRLLLIVCAAVAFAGWVKFLFDGKAVYLIDYVIRGLGLALVIWGCTFKELVNPPPRWVRALLLTAVIFYIDLSIYQVYRYFQVPDPIFYNHLFPRLSEGTFRSFDLSFGLALVALSEEAVFRHLFARLWRHQGWPLSWLYLASSVAFGLLHLPQGLALVTYATVTGLLFMFLYRDSGSLWPVVAVHYALDALIFSGAGCASGVTDCPPA